MRSLQQPSEAQDPRNLEFVLSPNFSVFDLSPPYSVQYARRKTPTSTNSVGGQGAKSAAQRCTREAVKGASHPGV